MKTTKSVLRIILFAFLLHVTTSIPAQVNPSPSGYIPSSQEYWDAVPLMTLSPKSAAVNQPVEVDNSTQIFFPQKDKPAALSRNLLLSAGLIEYDEPIKLDDGLKTMPVYKPGVQAAQSQKLKVYPNPANTFITVSWNAPGQDNTTLVIHDVNGRQVHTLPLHGLHNETIVDITGFVQGTYTVSLSQGGKTIATETLVIAK